MFALVALVHLAHAAPPLPMLQGEGTAVALGAVARVDSDALVDPGCGGPACDAVRERSNVGAFVQGQLYPWLGGYASVTAEHSAISAAYYADEGIALDAGLSSALFPRRPNGVLAWIHATAASAGEAGATRSSRAQLEAGAAWRVGDPGGGLFGYLGGNALVVGDDELNILGGEVEIPLAPALPAEAVGGVVVTSEPLGSFNSRSRLFLAVDARLGARVGVGLTLGLGL